MLLLTMLLAAGGYLAFVVWAGWRDVARVISAVGVSTIAVALTLSLVNYALRFWRWQQYLLTLGYKVALLDSLRIYIAGFALTAVPLKSGEAISSVILKRHGVPYSASLAAFLAERLSDVTSLLVLIAAGLSVYPPARPLVLVLACIIALVLVCLTQRRWLARCREFAVTRVTRGPAKLLAVALDVALHGGRLFQTRMLLLGIVLGIAAWSAEGMALYYLLSRLEFETSLQFALFAYPFSLLIGALSFLPGGLGGTEATLAFLLILNGMPAPLAVAATVLIRLTTLWFGIALGVTAVAANKWQN